MKPSLKSRLVSLDAKLSKTVQFKTQDDEESHGLRNAVIGAGALAAGYGAASTIRGKLALAQKRGYNNSTVRGAVEGLKVGHSMNVADAAAKVAPAAAAVSKYAGGAGKSVSAAASNVAAQATKVGRSSKAAALIAFRKARRMV